MLSRWPIRRKLSFCLALLLLMLVTLSLSGIRSIYRYRSLARGISRRAAELPKASNFAQQVSELRVTLSLARYHSKLPGETPGSLFERERARVEFSDQLEAARKIITEYKLLLQKNQEIEESDWRADQNMSEASTLHDIEGALGNVATLSQSEDYFLDREDWVNSMEDPLEQLQELSTELPSCLQSRMSSFKDEVQGEYRRAIVLIWTTTALAAFLLSLIVRLLYVWVLQPFRQMLHGSRRVARGDFNHRILLSSRDEMAELAHAMNSMTRRFQEIRDDLDQQVRTRTKEVLRSEQLASVGFLAAGVAHEINNPLASIALCAESLEDRMHDIIQCDDAVSDEDHNAEIGICRNYLRMMQDEAFRCKEITERLLDFARIGEVERQSSDLAEIVNGVIEMVRHLGKYKDKQIVCDALSPVMAPVNPQEFKQVVLNLITNALNSLERGGKVTVHLREIGRHAELQVVDDGCGMTEEVKEHLFEPFFTRRADGQGTGLGMSITYRIVCDHGGSIRAKSDGPGTGSTLTVSLPLVDPESDKESGYQHQAA